MSGSKERRGLPVLGPLGELFPSLRNPPEALPPAAVHPRVLIADDGDTRAFVVVVWDDPGGESALHSEVRVRVEGALLAELCRPAAELREAAIRPSSIQALFFTEVAGRVEVALRAFGLRAAELPPTTLAATMAHVRGEAQQSGREVPEVPTSSWQASFALPPGERGQTLLALERAIAERVGDEPWGERPGAFFAALAEATRALGLGAIEPTGDGLDALERLAIHYTAGPIRWIPPFVFQALCDMVGVVASREHGRRVEWATSTVDSRGLASPPLFRVSSREGPVHVPIGLHLLRWCVMPVGPGEVVPPVSDWVLDQFGANG